MDKTKRVNRLLGFTLLSISALSALANDMQGASPIPIGKTSESVTQLRIHFPEGIVKKDAFRVNCVPETKGSSSWADNDTKWTYNFESALEYEAPRLPGGASCDVVQTEELQSVKGRVWKSGTINYSFYVAGPNVKEVIPASGFQNTLRDKEPVVLVVFDGDIDRDRFFSKQSGYLSYVSRNAPAEKLNFSPVPKEQAEELFAHFKANSYLYGAEYKSKNWVLATLNRSLIPGSEVSVKIQNVTSGYKANIISEQNFSQKFQVRSNFKAELTCTSSTTTGTPCLPNSPIVVSLNGKVKWADIKDSYIEYIPYKSKDRKTVRATPVTPQSDGEGWFNTAINSLSETLPVLARFSDTLVESISFEVEFEPETDASVVLPSNLKDIEGRRLAENNSKFRVRVGSMAEMMRIPQPLSFFERKAGGNLSLPVAIVNLNQKISIRKTGQNKTEWKPISDIPTIIEVIRAYEARGDYRKTKQYVSPLNKFKSTQTDMTLSGQKNRGTFIQVPFSLNANGQVGGFYAIEVSSPSYEDLRAKEMGEGYYFNPRYTLAQVTDLAAHVKVGNGNSLVWVTRLSDGLPVPNAQVEIYNCVGQKVTTATSDVNGLATVKNQEWAADCGSNEQYSSYLNKKQFYVVAKTSDDFTLTHSSWSSSRSYAFGAPGVDYFYNDITENAPFYHGVIGVNLVKPGQKVPVEIHAKWPNEKGFLSVPGEILPKRAKVVSIDDDKLFYEFDLEWNSDRASFTWNVPNDGSIKLGRYDIRLLGADEKSEVAVNSGGGIEVAEFKVPLMSGILSFPTAPLVLPKAIPVNGVIRYANGVGAKELAVDLSYYFEPTTVRFEGFDGFSFGSGVVRIQSQEAPLKELPDSNRPETISGIRTNKDGAVVRDLASEVLGGGKTVGDVLQTIDRPQRLVTRLRYQDQMGEYQTLSRGKNIFNAHSFIGAKIVGGEPGKAQLQVAVVDVNGKNVTSPSSVIVSLYSIESKVIGEELYGGLIKNTVERELKPLDYGWTCADQEKMACSIQKLKAGSYAFQTTDNRTKQSAHVLFKVDSSGKIYDEGDYYSEGDEDSQRQLPLALDKPLYKGGERAVVSFPAPFKQCSALITVERSDVIDAFVSLKACERGSVELPVNADLAPNAFVSVYAVSGRLSAIPVVLGELDLGRPNYRLGFANMKVDWNRYKANVDVKTNKEKYEPREEVEVQVSVKSENGSLGTGSVTLVALEEKILQLKANESYKILEAMMQLRGHDVVTVTPLERIETVSASDSADVLLGAAKEARKGGDEGGDGSSSNELRRRIFDAMVAFQSNVPVVNGQATIRFKTNDNLTRYKVFAIVSSTNNKFGLGEASYLTEKETQSYSNIPSVAYSEDKLPIRVTLQNNTSKKQNYRTEVTSTAKDSSGNALETKSYSKSVALEKANSVAVEVGEMTFPEGTDKVEYVVRVFDESGRLVDSMSPEAQVVLPNVPLAVHHSYLQQVEKGGALNLRLNKEETALPNQGAIKVALSSSLVGGALDQIDKRIDQNTFADFFIESRVHKALLKSTAKNPERLKKALESLVGYVDSNGLVKYSPQAQRGDVWLTASIINVLQSQQWAMNYVPPALVLGWKQAVAAVLNKTLSPDYVGKTPAHWIRAQSVMGVAAFAFADQKLEDLSRKVAGSILKTLASNKTAFGEVIENWNNGALLDLWLFEVYALPEGALRSPRYMQLTNPSRLAYAGNSASLLGRPEFLWDVVYSDQTLETSKLLYGLAHLKGDPGTARALAAGLVNASGSEWYGLRTMAWVAGSLRGFGSAYEAEAVKGQSRIELVEERQTQQVDWDSASPVKALNSPWKSDQESVVVSHSGLGYPWVSVQALTAVPLTTSQGQGLSLEKEVKNVTSGSSDNHQPGDIIEVTLKINAASNTSHVALSDPIPSGSNILSEAYGFYSSGEKSYRGYKLYFGYLPQGKTIVKYQYQLNNPGTFKLPPTRAEGLYIPSIFGEVPNGTVVVK